MPPKKHQALVWFFCGLLWLGAAAGWGDVVYLKNGNSIEGQVQEAGAEYLVKTPRGTLRIWERDVAAISATAEPRDIFLNRLANSARDPNACVLLALWANKNGLLQESILALRKALLVDPENPRAQALLKTYQAQLEELRDSPAANERLLSDLGGSFELLQTEHFRVAYNGDALFAEVTGELLERVHKSFFEFFGSRRFSPAMLAERLDIVLFRSKREFENHAAGAMPEMRNSRGYYSTSDNRCFYYDAVNDGDFARHKAQIQQAIDQVKKFRAEAQKNPPGMEYTLTIDDKQLRLDRAGLLAELQKREAEMAAKNAELRQIYLESNISTTVHEAVHQLCYNTGVMSRFAENPKWLSEGIALYFEAAENGSWDGAGRLHATRLAQYRENPLSLRELLINDSLFNLDLGRSEAAYANSWAVIYYLAQKKHELLFDYIFALSERIESPPYTAEARVRDFENFFGMIETVQADWRRTIGAIK